MSPISQAVFDAFPMADVAINAIILVPTKGWMVTFEVSDNVKHEHKCGIVTFNQDTKNHDYKDIA